VLRSDHEVRPQGGTRRLALVAAIHCGFDLDARFATCKTTSTLQGQVSQLGRRVDHPFKPVHANVGVVLQCARTSSVLQVARPSPLHVSTPVLRRLSVFLECLVKWVSITR